MHSNIRRSLAGVWLTTLIATTGCGAFMHQQNPSSVMSSEIAEVFVAHHAYDEATPLLQRAMTEDPNNPRIHAMLGMVLRDRGLYEQAQIELGTAYRMDPTDVDSVAGLAVLYDMMNDGKRADEWHRKAIELSPERGDLYNNLGFSLFLRHRNADAVAAYEEALRRDPGARRVFNNMGFALAREKKYEDALRSFEQAGNKAMALTNMGLAYHLAGNVASARAFYEEALRVDRKMVLAQQNLDLLSANKLPEEAIQ